MKRFAALVSVFWSCISLCSAQMFEPVEWSAKDSKKGNELTLTFKASIEDSWHMYGLEKYENGPQHTEFTFETLEGAELSGKLKVVAGSPIKHFDDVFGMDLTYFENSVSIAQSFKITGEQYKVAGYVTYMSCNDGSCTPPTTYEFSFAGNGVVASKTEADKAAKNTTAHSGEFLPETAILSPFTTPFPLNHEASFRIFLSV